MLGVFISLHKIYGQRLISIVTSSLGKLLKVICRFVVPKGLLTIYHKKTLTTKSEVCKNRSDLRNCLPNTVPFLPILTVLYIQYIISLRTYGTYPYIGTNMTPTFFSINEVS